MAFEKTYDDKVILDLLKDTTSSEKGFRLLVDTYKERLYYHIRRLVGDHDDADDVLQNVFVKVYRNIAGFEEKSGLYTWIYKIATNESLSFIKSRSRKSTVSLDGEINQGHANTYADNFIDESQIQKKLLQAIDQLPEKQKEVFQLRYYEEMAYEQMSEITGTSVGALKASYHHAAKKIEAFIKGIE